MHISHLAIWCRNLDTMKDFYVRHFSANASEMYTNQQKHFTSYFLTFNEKCRLELMHKPGLKKRNETGCGLVHLAIATGSKDKVIQLTNNIILDGYELVTSPRATGNGLFESVIKDPEGNLVEITI